MSHKRALFPFKKNARFFLCTTLAALALTMTSCGDSAAGSNDTFPTPTLTPLPDAPTAVITEAPSAADATPTPTLPPVVTGDAAAIARQQILEFLPAGNYDVTLLSDTLKIASDNYYTFYISQKGTVIEPLIIVNQKTNELKCISSDSIVSDITTHPLYQKPDAVKFTWEGNYSTLDAADIGVVPGAYLTIQPYDDAHFQFTAYMYPSDTLSELSGIAAIQSGTASFSSEDGITLTFTPSEHNLIITQTGGTDLSFSGTYLFTEQALPSSAIGAEAALQQLLALSQKQAGLARPLSDYYFYISDSPEIVHNHLCYDIQAFLPEQNRLRYIAQFYITTDGSRIYRTETSSEDGITIFSISGL